MSIPSSKILSSPVEAFTDEDACRSELERVRFGAGFHCTHCGHAHAAIHEKTRDRSCLKCRLPTSLTAGTFLHKTRTNLLDWFEIARAMANNAPGTLSIAEIHRRVKIASYRTVWDHVLSIRQGFSESALPKLRGQVELSDTLLQCSSYEGFLLGAMEIQNSGEYGSMRLTLLRGSEQRYEVERFLKTHVEEGATIRTDLGDPISSVSRFEIKPTAVGAIQRELGLLSFWYEAITSELHPSDLSVYLDEYAFRGGRRMEPKVTFENILKILMSDRQVNH